MATTLLEYLDDSYKFNSRANVVKTEQLKDSSGNTGQRYSIILDKTIFYPQGGGQPYDTGTISSTTGKFAVHGTRFNDGFVLHLGEFETGFFADNAQVELFVNPERRMLLSKLHSAGHLLDVAMINLGYRLPPTKGYHFPDGPYVEYAGEIPPEKREELCHELEQELRKLISKGTEVKNFVVANKEELSQYCDFIPDYIPKDKPIRIVAVENYPCPCGGTHVKNTGELGQVKVSKIKVKGGNVRVSYGIVGS